MTIIEARAEDSMPEDDSRIGEQICSFIKLALVLAAVAGALALTTGWFGGIGIDGSDLMSWLGGKG